MGPVTQTSMTLKWLPGIDNVGVHHYNVYLGGSEVAEVGPLALSYTYTGLACGTSYAQGLTVEDAAGNTSNLAEATWARSTAACDPSPPSAGYPNASNTGPTGPLAESTGNISVGVAGTVIQDRKINGCITVNADNVTIRNSEIHCNQYGIANLNAANTGLLIEDVLIECGHQPGDEAVTAYNYTIRRSEAFGCENVLWCNANCVIEDNYLHDPICYSCWPQPWPHTDTIQVSNGGSNIRIEHNTVYGAYTSRQDFGNGAFSIAEATGHSVTNVVVNNNLVAGGGYTLRCPDRGTFTWNNNRFSRIYVSTVGGWGPIFPTCLRHPRSGNVYHETGEPIG